MISVSASGLERCFACPAAAVLPREHETSAAAERGTAIHAYLTAALTTGDHAAALASVPELYRAECAALDASTFTQWSDVLGCELAFALHVPTGTVKYLGANIGRDYPSLGDDWVCGSLDLVLTHADGWLECVDYKTGRPVTDAGRNAQMLFAGYVAARYYGHGAVRVTLAYLTDEGSWIRDSAELDELDLDEFLQTLRAAHARWVAADSAEEPESVRGPQCDYCPAKRHCRLYAEETTALARFQSGTLAAIVAQIEADAAAAEWWLNRIKIIEDGAAKIKAAARAQVERGAVPGWKMLACKKRVIQSRVALPVLQSQFGAQLASDVVEISQSAIERELGKQDAERAMAAIADAGGVVLQTYTRLYRSSK